MTDTMARSDYWQAIGLLETTLSGVTESQTSQLDSVIDAALEVIEAARRCRVLNGDGDGLGPKRFGGRPGLTKEDIAGDVFYILEGDESAFTEEQAAVIIEQIVARMSDESAQKWMDEQDDALSDGPEDGEEAMLERQRSTDLVLLDSCGFTTEADENE